MFITRDGVDVTHAIDSARFSPFQVFVTALCAAIAMLDGFDTQSIAYVAPVIAKAWGMNVAAFGPIFGVGLLGLTIGALVFGPAADVIGRKRVILLSTAIFGVFALLTATATSFTMLLLFRLLTGIGLGGAMPNIIAITSEYSPQRLRATVITVMFCGFPLGSTLGGFLGAKLIPDFGWESVFVVGGVLPLLLLVVLAIAMPESIRYLVAKGTASTEVARLLGRIDPAHRYAGTETFVLPEERVTGFTVKHLFMEGRARMTLLLWVAFFMNLLVMYFLVNWMPSLLRQAGLPIGTAIISTAMLNLGGIVGAVVLGRLIDRIGPYTVLGPAYASAALFIVAVAFAGSHTGLLMASVFCAGFGIVGAQIGMNALTASLYPTAIRSTGVGWALGIGRVGSIAGPVVGGLLLGATWGAQAILLLAAVPALIAALAVFALGRSRRLSGEPLTAAMSAP
jgi:MFS transporter, AAHS family, 4-hydroxybenzoate transporter